MTPVTIQVLGCILFLAVGLLGTLWARTVQTYELKLYSGLNPIPLLSFLQEYVGSESYIWQVRAVGAFCLFAAGVFFYALLQWAH
jgi:hypothetical protein